MAGYGIYGLRWLSGHWSEGPGIVGYRLRVFLRGYLEFLGGPVTFPVRKWRIRREAGSGMAVKLVPAAYTTRPCRVVQDGVPQHPCCLRSSLQSWHRRLVDHLRTISAEQVRRISDACQRHRPLTRRPTTKTGDPASAGFFVARVASVLHGINSNTLKSPQISGFQCNVLPHEKPPMWPRSSHEVFDYIGFCWCPRTESNRRPSVYKTAALPAELQGHGAPVSIFVAPVKTKLCFARECAPELPARAS